MISLSRIEVTPQKEKQFESKGITSVEELVSLFPRKYIDFREAVRIKDLSIGKVCRVTGKILSRQTGSMTSIVISDGTGTLKLTWFQGCYFAGNLNVGDAWSFCGKVGEYKGMIVMNQPMLHSQNPQELSRIFPFYSKIKGMSDNYLREKIASGISLLAVNDVWTERDALARSLGLIEHIDAIRQMHNPSSGEDWKKASCRVAFDNIYAFYEELMRRGKAKEFCTSKQMANNNKTLAFIKGLPYQLTEDQMKAAMSIIENTNKDSSYSAIVSGDVGCGKTAVAAVASVLAWENGYQSIVMAPTLILARQHFMEFQAMTASLGIKVALLTSQLKAKERKKVLSDLASGEVDILVGTHAVLSGEISYHNLGMTIVDEEHRFSTRQKGILEDFDKQGAHHISMTATPIPRSYALAIYGNETDVLAIQTMPSGRKPVITSIEPEREEVYQKLLDEIAIGHQGYVVCPFIEDFDDERFADVLSVTKVTEELKAYCKANAPQVTVAHISGDMKQDEILKEIDKFAAGETHLLVSTTIIEVGVNVPNATAIAIMNAERFGLSALHQLRGRVGRKGDQGYCYLVSDRQPERLSALTQYSSGFKIAEVDFEMRGPGEVLGEAQTGDSKIIELIMRRPKMAHVIRSSFQQQTD